MFIVRSDSKRKRLFNINSDSKVMISIFAAKNQKGNRNFAQKSAKTNFFLYVDEHSFML